ncbi:MAG: DMT family transporter [Patescibacteria group bacterium]
MKKNSSNHHGILALLTATFFFSLNTLFNRFVPVEIGTFFQLFLRTTLMSVLFLLVGLILKDFSSVKGKDWPLFITRGLLVAGDFALFFIAVNQLPLATTLFLFYAGSIITNYLYGLCVLKEKLTKQTVGGLLLALCGLVFIYSDGLSSLAQDASIFAVASGVFFGLMTATSKNLSIRYSVTQINIIAYITAALAAIPLMSFQQEQFRLLLPNQTWILFGGFALTTFIAFYAVIYGYKYVEAQKASLVLLTEILFIVLFGFLFFQEIPTMHTFIGGICILFALVLPNISLPKKNN